ncbi:MAG: efflux RND transporter permease subunit [Spirochaetales bacterium]|nr:efflux RND transporter permease subunit [Spirochaetales bacterium]
MSIGTFSVKNRVLLNILFILVLLLGYFSIVRVPKEQFSEVPFYWVNIIVPYPGASAEDVEREVTINIEKEMQGIDELKEINSETGEGLSVVRVEFNDGINQDKFDKLYQEVQTRFAKASLPDGVLDETISDFSSNDFVPLIEVALSGEIPFDSLWDSARLLKEQIDNIKEVSGVELVGAGDREIFIQVDPFLMEAKGLSLEQVSRAIATANQSIPGGTLETPGHEYLLKTEAAVERQQDFGNIILRRTERGGSIFLRDIAQINQGFDSGDPRARFNGITSVTLRITKVPGGNSLAIVKNLNKTIADLRPVLHPELKVDFLNDSTIGIKKSLNVLLNNAIVGLVLLVLILFYFFGLRNALLAAVGIPVTFAITFVILELSGETLNSNTLFGLVLVLGMIVDHSIVIIENSYRYRESGLSRHDAAIKGVDQVWKPVIAASLTTVAAFLPLMLLPGTIGKFLRVIPLTVTIALLASTGEALLFLPSHYAEWPGKDREKNEKGFFLRLHKVYNKVLEKLYKRKGLTVIVTLALMFGSCAIFPLLEQDLFSAEDFTFFSIKIEMPPGTTLDRTDRIVSQYEEKILPLLGEGDISGISSSIGFQGGSSENSARNNVAEITVDLYEQDEGRKKSITSLMEDIKALTSDIPGPDRVLFEKAQNGPPTDPPVSFRIFGNSYDELQELSRAIKEKLSGYAEIFNIKDNFEAGTTEIRIRVNQERAARFGLDLGTIGRFIRTTVEGIKVTSFFKDNNRYDVILGFTDNRQWDISRLEQLNFLTQDGRQVPFTAIAKLENGSAPAAVKRVDGKREITIEAEAYSTDRLKEINKAIQSLYQEEFKVRYPDIRLVTGGEFAEFNDLLVQILRIFLIGIFLIYLILATQFHSYSQPLLIMISVPLALMGVMFYLLISGTPFSTTVLYAGVALAGIAVNDSIVLISFINELRAGGKPFIEAVREAASTRFRPIIVTSVTTIAGLLPTALGIGGKSVVWSPMAGTIIFGLLFSTITALVFLPSLYGLFYEKKALAGSKTVQ